MCRFSMPLALEANYAHSESSVRIQFHFHPIFYSRFMKTAAFSAEQVTHPVNPEYNIHDTIDIIAGWM